MRTRKEASKESIMHFASAYHEDIFDGIGDKSRLPLAGRYLRFNGVDQRVAFGVSLISLNAITDSVHIVLWLRLNNVTSTSLENFISVGGSVNGRIILSKMASNDATYANRLRVFCDNSKSYYSETELPLAEWFQLEVILSSGNEPRVKINRTSIALTAQTTEPIYTANFVNAITFGGFNTTSCSEVDFSLAALIQGELSDEEVTNLYSQGFCLNSKYYLFHFEEGNSRIFLGGTVRSPSTTIFSSVLITNYISDMWVNSAENGKGYSISNKYGYGESTTLGNTPVLPSLPNPHSSQYDTLFEGQVHYPIQVKEHCLTSSGVSMKIAMADLTGVTITSSLGTATPSIVGNDIELTAGTLYNLKLSDGTILGLTEGSGTTVYDMSGNGNHGVISNPDLDCWDYFQYEYSNNHRGYNNSEVELYNLKEEWVVDSLGTDLSNVIFDSPTVNQFNILRNGSTDTYVAIDLNSLNLVQSQIYTLSLYSTDYVGQPLVSVHTPQVYRANTNNDTTWSILTTGVSFTLGETNVYKEVTFVHDEVLGRYLIIGQVSGGGRQTNWIFEGVKIASATNQISSPYAAKIPCSLLNHHYDVLGNKLAAPLLNGKYMLPSTTIKFNPYDAPELYNKTEGLIDSSTELKASEIANQFPEILGVETDKKISNIEAVSREFNPKDCPAILDYWFTPRNGITVDGSNFVTSIVNQGERVLELNSLAGVQPNFPIYNPTGFLGQPAFEFTGTNAIRGTASGEILDYSSSWFAVVFQDYFPADDDYLVDFQNIVRFQMRRTGYVRIQLSNGTENALKVSDTGSHILVFTIDQFANGYILIDSLSEVPLTLSNVVTGSPNAAVSVGAAFSGGAPCTGLMTDFMWGRGLLPLGWAKRLMTYLAQQNNFTLI